MIKFCEEDKAVATVIAMLPPAQVKFLPELCDFTLQKVKVLNFVHMSSYLHMLYRGKIMTWQACELQRLRVVSKEKSFPTFSLCKAMLHFALFRPGRVRLPKHQDREKPLHFTN